MGCVMYRWWILLVFMMIFEIRKVKFYSVGVVILVGVRNCSFEFL